MGILIHGANVYKNGDFVRNDIRIDGGIVSQIDSCVMSLDDDFIFDMNNCFVFPGLIDVHVHLREPGYFYKETIKTGTLAAAHGGFTTVCAMPNLDPVPDCSVNLEVQEKLIERDACIHVYPYGSISVGQKQGMLSDMAEMSDRVVAFTDDGVGVQSSEMMEEAMKKAKALGKIIVAHCEDNSLLNGSYVHDGEFARVNGFLGNPSESEWRQLERDLELVLKTGCDYHVCHISTKESVELIRRAKAKGLPVTCETAPHYLTLCDLDLKDQGRFRMNPPIRSSQDRDALIEGLRDGTIDMIITDHAPHTQKEKSGGLRNSSNGVVGLETSFSVSYTKLVKTGLISLTKLIELMHENPAKRFKIGTPLEIGMPADLTVFDLNEKYTVDPNEFLSMGKASPFEGDTVFGKCMLTMAGGKTVYDTTKR